LGKTFDYWKGVGREGRPGTVEGGGSRRRMMGSTVGKRPGTSGGSLMKGDIDFSQLKPLNYQITKNKGIEKAYAKKKDRRLDTAGL